MSTPPSPLRILVLEDDPNDLEILVRTLERDGISFQHRCVDTEQDFLRELESFKPDLVLSDFSMPSFDGLSALRLQRDRRPDLPFIFVSGTIGEDQAVDALKRGATDYLVKGHLRRLPQAVRRAIAEARQHEERRRLEAQLQHAMKMEAIGRLAGGIAHDFNNLLTAILGYSDILLRTPHIDDLKPGLTEIHNAGRRASDLTRQLLAFSRKQVLDFQVCNLNTIISGTEKLLGRIIGEDVRLATKLDPGLPLVRVDPGQMEQVIVNLAVNSRDAMASGGRITVETRSVRLEQAGNEDVPGFKPGVHVVLSVSDTGHGMDQATLARIFEPFFTTKPAGKGTGLGLATVYGIVSQSGGFIRVESAAGVGTTFSVFLPSTTGQVRKPATTPPPTTLRGVETLLLVEDDAGVRRYASAVLASHGYFVLEAPDGPEAIQVAANSAAPPVLVVTDLVMPRMSGRELAMKLHESFPDARFLFVSGYSTETIPDSEEIGAPADFLAKPFRPGDLLKKVREVLDRR